MLLTIFNWDGFISNLLRFIVPSDFTTFKYFPNAFRLINKLLFDFNYTSLESNTTHKLNLYVNIVWTQLMFREFSWRKCSPSWYFQFTPLLYSVLNQWRNCLTFITAFHRRVFGYIWQKGHRRFPSTDFNLLLFDSQSSKNHYHNNFQCLRYCVYFLNFISLYWRKNQFDLGAKGNEREETKSIIFQSKRLPLFGFSRWTPTLHLFVINRFLVGQERENIY